VIRATFEIGPPGAASDLAVRLGAGMAGGAEAVQARLVAEECGRAVLEVPESNWGDNVPLLVSTLVAGEAMELRRFDRCRLVGLELPDGWLPGPAVGGAPGVAVGVIVKPALGLSPAEVAGVARAAVAGGAGFVKDDETLGDPVWCPLVERVRAVAAVLEPGVVYCPNVTGPTATLLDRARRAVELGATGVMVNAFAQGLDAVLALRQAGLGVPVFAHRVGGGPWSRNERYGATTAVLARLTRLCGADYVVGAFGGSLFDDDDAVDANLEAVRGPCGRARPAVAVLGGGLGPLDVASQVERAGGDGLLVCLGSAAYAHPGGLEAGVAVAVDALRR
jgi:ribulose 1,5-bisphosphate carboxylase large subunit-like protein